MSTFKFSKLRDCAIAPSPKTLIAPDQQAYELAEDLEELAHRVTDLQAFIQNHFRTCDVDTLDYACYVAGSVLEILEEAVK